MLVLSRKALEKIVIGDDVVITVNEIRGNQVKLGVEAPGDVPIRRSELLGERRTLNVEHRTSNGKDAA